jgi:hypothetical protein
MKGYVEMLYICVELRAKTQDLKNREQFDFVKITIV